MRTRIHSGALTIPGEDHEGGWFQICRFTNKKTVRRLRATPETEKSARRITKPLE